MSVITACIMHLAPLLLQERHQTNQNQNVVDLSFPGRPRNLLLFASFAITLLQSWSFPSIYTIELDLTHLQKNSSKFTCFRDMLAGIPPILSCILSDRYCFLKGIPEVVCNHMEKFSLKLRLEEGPWCNSRRYRKFLPVRCMRWYSWVAVIVVISWLTILQAWSTAFTVVPNNPLLNSRPLIADALALSLGNVISYGIGHLQGR